MAAVPVNQEWQPLHGRFSRDYLFNGLRFGASKKQTDIKRLSATKLAHRQRIIKKRYKKQCLCCWHECIKQNSYWLKSYEVVHTTAPCADDID
jgi:hypothetical protein